MRAADSNGASSYDLAIVGSGGAAFAAAIAGRRRGLRVAMIERGTIGGTCVNVGCVPSKALLAAAEARHRARVNRFPDVAAKQGAIAVENAFDGSVRHIDCSALRRITFTTPTIASAGITEAQAHAQGIDCRCRVVDLENLPRAIVSRNAHGVVKLVAERDSGRVLGVHLLAEGGGNAILAGVYAIEAGRTVADLAYSWDPYLTIGEAIHCAALAFTRDPSKLSRCAA